MQARYHAEICPSHWCPTRGGHTKGDQENVGIRQVNGFAAGYESTGDQGRRSAAFNFFDIIVGAHSYATGGSNDGEAWGPPYQLGSTIAAVRSFLPHPLLHPHRCRPPPPFLPILELGRTTRSI
jgi:DUF1680 family protein